MNRKHTLVAVAGLITAGWMSLAVLAQQPTTPAPAAPAPAPQAPRPAARSPIPDHFTNLQALPKDISKPELVGIMKTFSVTLDKRCSFCHVASDDLSQADFALDEKETKRKARALLKKRGSKLLEFIREAREISAGS
jgi:hypothetical protein